VEATQILPIDLAIIGLLSSRPRRAFRAGVEVAPMGITAEFADRKPAPFLDPVHPLLLGKVPIDDHILLAGQQMGLDRTQVLKTGIDPRVVLGNGTVVRLFRRPFPLSFPLFFRRGNGRRGRSGLLDRERQPGVAFPIDDAEGGDLQTLFRTTRAPVPEKLTTLGLLTRFGDEAGIEGDDSFTFRPEGLVDQRSVEGDRIKPFGELTRVGLFRKLAVAAQVAESNLSTNRQDGGKQGHQKFPLRFGDGESIEYLFYPFHECRLSDEGCG
jgi:hypothetical protein